MVDFKLANVLLEHNERFFQYPDLYYHSASPIVRDPATGASALLPNSQYDFTTYFNSFSSKKWREYTVVDDVRFHVEIKGKAQVTFFTLRAQPVGVGMTVVGTVDIDNDDFEVLEYQLPRTDDELFSFRIVTWEPTLIRDGYYYAKVDESQVRPVHLALATTTFKKEEFISRNVELFKNEVLGGNDPCAGHASMIVVDNGRTLDPAALEGSGVWVFPNKNVGGSGGFARGMMEAKRLPVKESVTHVLIMDDDISLSSESVKRTFNLVTLVDDDHVDAFVSGAMFSLGDQYVQVEDVGFTNVNGQFGPVKTRSRMANYVELVQNEAQLPVRENKYAAFWYCCIPMTTVKREGLPLPLFIRYDDAEYGQRCKPIFMTMNGINVWHEDFVDRYNSYYERYCGVRNSLVIQGASGVCPNVDFFGTLFKKQFIQEIKKYNYADCELMLDAIEDYLKGPEFLEVERCEELLKEKMAKCERMVPLSELDTSGIDLAQAKVNKRMKTWPGRLNKVTLNGQRLMPERLSGKRAVAVEFNANNYPGSRLHLRRRYLVVNRLGTMGCFREMDKNRYRELMKRYRTLKRRFEREHDEVTARYAERGDYLKSDEFWAKYLELDNSKQES